MIFQPFSFIQQVNSAAPWTPANIATVMWFDADDLSTITLQSNVVTQWQDKSGNNRNATQGIMGRQPTYITNVYNGKPTIRGDGTDDTMVISPFSVSGGIRAYGVINQRFKNNQFGLNGDWLWMTNTTAILPIYGANTNGGGWYSSFFSTGRPLIPSSSIPVDTLALAYIEQTGTALKARVFNYFAESSTSFEFNGSPVNRFQLWSNPAGFTANIDISEVIFIQSPTLDEQQKIEGYLAWKWGLVNDLPANHPYKNAPPTT